PGARPPGVHFVPDLVVRADPDHAPDAARPPGRARARGAASGLGPEPGANPLRRPPVWDVPARWGDPRCRAAGRRLDRPLRGAPADPEAKPEARPDGADRPGSAAVPQRGSARGGRGRGFGSAPGGPRRPPVADLVAPARPRPDTARGRNPADRGPA